MEKNKQMFFLSQMELVARFPPSEVENLPVWHHVLFRALSQDTYLHVQAEIIGLTQKVLTDWQDGGYKLGQMDKVVRIFCYAPSWGLIDLSDPVGGLCAPRPVCRLISNTSRERL